MVNQEKESKKLFGVLLVWKEFKKMSKKNLTIFLDGFQSKYPINVYPIRNQEDYKNFLRNKERIDHVELVLVKTGDENLICVNPERFYTDEYDGVWKKAVRDRIYKDNEEGLKQHVFASLKSYWQERDTIRILDLRNEGEKLISKLESVLQS